MLYAQILRKERFLFFGCMHDLRKKIKSELSPKPCSTDVVKSFKNEFRFFTTLCVEKKLDLSAAHRKIKVTEKLKFFLCVPNPEI